MSSQEQVDFVVDRSDLRRCQFVRAPLGAPTLAPGQVLVRVDQLRLHREQRHLRASSAT